MLHRQTLYRWFSELGLTRGGLPYELVQVFSESEGESLQQAIEVGFDHIERTLDFRFFVAEEESDPEQLWYDLLARLDDQSYYAVLAMPLVRQVLEHRTSFISEKVPENLRLSWGGDFGAPQSDLYASERGIVIAEAKALASKFRAIEEWYRFLSSSEEFANWCKYFLNCAAQLVLLASSVCLNARKA